MSELTEEGEEHVFDSAMLHGEKPVHIICNAIFRRKKVYLGMNQVNTYKKGKTFITTNRRHWKN